MPCPHCGSSRTREQPKKTSLGYRTFRCLACTRRFNERTGTPFDDLSVPTDVVFLVVLWRLRYPLSLRHLAEMFLERDFAFSHETVRSWEVCWPISPPSRSAGSGNLHLEVGHPNVRARIELPPRRRIDFSASTGVSL